MLTQLDLTHTSEWESAQQQKSQVLIKVSAKLPNKMKMNEYPSHANNILSWVNEWSPICPCVMSSTLHAVLAFSHYTEQGKLIAKQSWSRRLQVLIKTKSILVFIYHDFLCIVSSNLVYHLFQNNYDTWSFPTCSSAKFHFYHLYTHCRYRYWRYRYRRSSYLIPDIRINKVAIYCWYGYWLSSYLLLINMLIK